MTEAAGTNASTLIYHEWIGCHDCGMLQTLPVPVSRQSRHCTRCDASFGNGLIRSGPALAFIITAAVLFLVANLIPLLAIELGGRGESVHLASGVVGLADHDLGPLALFVLGISILDHQPQKLEAL